MRLLAAALVVIGALAGLPAAAAPPGGGSSSFEEFRVANERGEMRYRVYVPAALRRAAPLVVALHGGNDSIEQTAAVSGWNELADQHGFLVAYPQEDPNNGRLGIWNWASVARQGRDDRAASLVALMTTTVIERYGVDADRVMVTGMSAGGGMAVSMGAAYPDLFDVIGAEVGCGFGMARCTHPPSCSPTMCETTSLTNGVYLTAEDAGRAAYELAGVAAHRMPVIMSYGTADPAAAGVGQEDFLAQWQITNDLVDDGQANESVPRAASSTRTGAENGRTYTVETYDDAAGCDLIHRWIIDGMGHQYSGGHTDDGTPPDGPDLRAYMYEFLLAQTSRHSC